MVRRSLLALSVIAALTACQRAGNESVANNAAAADQEQLVSTEYEVVRAMLTLAGATTGDLVVDLGSGDGRIPIMAAREMGARGLGVEIDPQRIRQSNENARAAGVADRVTFRQEDLFVTPLNDVTVLTLYLLPEINLRLRPKILSQMRPGARVVSNTWDMGDWRPDQRQEVGGTTIFLWIVPASVEGRWRLTEGTTASDFTLTQRYQDVTAAGAPLGRIELRGDRISFRADLGQGGRNYQGRVEGNRIVGDGWEAVRIGD